MADSKRHGSPIENLEPKKRFCDNTSPGNLNDLDETSDPAFLSSTVLNGETDNVFEFMDSLPDSQRKASVADMSIKTSIVSALMDPEVVQLVSTALAVEVSNSLKAEIRHLYERLDVKDKEIEDLRGEVASLHATVDSLEQYSRRNNVRVSCIPESEG